MKSIVAVDLNWGIGCKGKLLVHLPEDLKYFKAKTMDKVVVMGKETFLSLPKEQPLPNRINIVLNDDINFYRENIIICRSLDELFAELQKYNTDDIFIIGGASVYAQLLPYCSEAFVTKIDNAYEADKYYVNLDKEENWSLDACGEAREQNDLTFRFTTYKNNSVKEWK